ncbi:BrnA antitoxin family protein [Devosia albogilva]|uniref:BrnA antitoxin family protein n=1 Tax=Devosia albogilva TaxID=429726 RepID=A0ABW5QLS8_9HYPH
MVHPTRRRNSVTENAEAAFKSLTTKPSEPLPRTNTVPTGKELVSLRIDRDTLEHFQAEGPGWQERINAALRAAAGLH